MKTKNGVRRWFTAGIAITGLLASTSTFADTGSLFWGPITLKSATGVPDNRIHKYILTGVLILKEGDNYHKGWATIIGAWDEVSQVAKETLTYNGDTYNSEIQGNVVAQFKCPYDPWMHTLTVRACIVANVSADQSGTQWSINWSSLYSQIERPFTSSQVTLQQAQALSEAAANNQPPPPPPPPKEPLVIKDVEITKAHIQNIQKPPASPDMMSSSSILKPGEIRGFNPQPEPPGKVMNPGEIRGFNPQPEPPGKVINPGEIRGFNPQPEPPGKVINPGEIRGFNPQPEPPGKGGADVTIAKNISAVAPEQLNASGKISNIIITPSNNVPVGTKVTVKVNGNGSCALIIDTHGASDEGNKADIYELPSGNFPRTIAFKAKKTGTFRIGAKGSRSNNQQTCSPNIDPGINTQLTVFGQINKSKAILR